MSPSATPQEQRVRPRRSVRLRVDARVLSEQERVDILAGLGFPELEHEVPSLPRPRSGFQQAESRDASGSGLRLALGTLAGVEQGGSISLDVHLPGERRVVRLLGDVIWSSDQGGEPLAGLRIAALDVEGLQRLWRALEKD